MLTRSMVDINWDELLPGYEWMLRSAKCWAHLMPDPSPQLSHLLPVSFGELV